MFWGAMHPLLLLLLLCEGSDFSLQWLNWLGLLDLARSGDKSRLPHLPLLLLCQFWPLLLLFQELLFFLFQLLISLC